MSSKRKVAYLDWSGDPGVRQVAGASDELVVVVAIVAEPNLMEREFAALRKRLRMSPGTEFHFAKAAEAIRNVFFSRASTWSFEAVALVVPKSAISGLTSARSGVGVIAAAAGALVADFPPGQLEGALLIVDAPDSDQPEVIQIAVAARRSLRAAGLKRGIEVRGYPADRQAGLQLADMLAGAIAKREAGETDYLAHLDQKIRVLRWQAK
ncbi:MAG: hypothetical protein HY023_12700 [Chloroflexi bacterium]|nr:hypothetical protein [Chloroflexota bacterium]